jgi:hypothetical protein
VPGAAAQDAVVDDDDVDFGWWGWQEAGGWGQWQQPTAWSSPAREEGRDGGREDVPTWDGRDPKLAVYLRKIRLWEAYTRTPPERRGIRLLAALEGDAFSKMELVEPASLAVPDSTQKFIELIRQRYEPLEHRRVGKVMDDFLFRFERRFDEEINDFGHRFDKELAEVEKVAGALTPNWKAHLF